MKYVRDCEVFDLETNRRYDRTLGVVQPAAGFLGVVDEVADWIKINHYNADFESEDGEADEGTGQNLCGGS